MCTNKIWKYGTQCMFQLFAQSLDLLLLVVFSTPAHRSRGLAVRAFSCTVDVLARAGFAPAVLSDQSNWPVRTIWCLVHTESCLVLICHCWPRCGNRLSCDCRSLSVLLGLGGLSLASFHFFTWNFARLVRPLCWY